MRGNTTAEGEDTRVRVLLAIVRGARTFGDLEAATGRNRSSLHTHVHRLRRQGLVAMTDGKQGTLRPLVYEVPFPRSLP